MRTIQAPLKAAFASTFFAAIIQAAPAPLPPADLPDGLELVIAAAPPVVAFPIMGCCGSSSVMPRD
jgi:hypothetical protein